MGEKSNKAAAIHNNGEVNNHPILEEDFECLHSRQLAFATVRNLGRALQDWMKTREIPTQLRQERRSNDVVTEMIRSSPYSSCNEFTIGASWNKTRVEANKED